jgi:hypothetical protein
MNGYTDMPRRGSGEDVVNGDSVRNGSENYYPQAELPTGLQSMISGP